MAPTCRAQARNGQPPTLEALCAAVSELWEQQSAFASSPSADVSRRATASLAEMPTTVAVQPNAHTPCGALQVADALAFLSQHLLQAPEDHRYCAHETKLPAVSSEAAQHLCYERALSGVVLCTEQLWLLRCPVSCLNRDAQQAKVRICRLAAAALAAAQRDALPAAAALVVCNALRVWADPTPADPVLQQAALTAIAAFIPANLRQVRFYTALGASHALRPRRQDYLTLARM